MKFEKITIPPGWQESFTKYPNGRTIFEALTATITSVNEGIDAVNTKVDQGLLAIDAAADTIRSEVNSSFLILQNKLEQDLEYLQDDLVADISVLQSQVDAAVASVADKVTQSQLAAVNAQLAETANRIDNIVTTPVPTGEIIAQEIIDARQGALSVGANIAGVKAKLADNMNQMFYINNTHSRQGNLKKDVLTIFDNLASWSKISGAGSAIANDTVNYKTGLQSIKWTATTEQCQAQIIKTFNLLGKNLYVDLYVEDVTKVQRVEFLFDTSNGSFTKYFTSGIPVYMLRNGWNSVSLRPNSFGKLGTAPLVETDLANINLTRVRIVNVAGQVANVTFDRMYAITNKLDKAKITLMFDDGHSTVYTDAKPIMDKYGFVGVSYVITNYPNNPANPNMMTLEQLKKLHENGWDICSHTNTHRTLTELTTTEIIDELTKSREWLLKNGFAMGARHLATPGGQWNNSVLDEVKKYYATHRATAPVEDCYPPGNPYVLQCNDVSSSTAVSTVQGWIDKAIANKSWLSILFHYVATPATKATEITHANLEAIMQYIASKDVDVVTVTDMIDNIDF